MYVWTEEGLCGIYAVNGLKCTGLPKAGAALVLVTSLSAYLSSVYVTSGVLSGQWRRPVLLVRSILSLKWFVKLPWLCAVVIFCLPDRPSPQ